METGKQQLYRFAQKWRALNYAEAVLYALGATVLVGLVVRNWLWAGGAGILALILALVRLRPWQYTVERSCAFIDAHLQEAQYSSSLLLQTSNNLSDLGRLQQYRIGQALENGMGKVRPPHQLKRAAILAMAMAAMGMAWAYFIQYQNVFQQGQRKEHMEFRATTDTIRANAPVPNLSSQTVQVVYPPYTRKGRITTEDPNIKAVEGSVITWRLVFEGDVQAVTWESMGQTVPVPKKDSAFVLKRSLHTSGFYNFRFVDGSGQSYATELYALEAVKDVEPSITINNLDEYSYFEHQDKKTIAVAAQISDDYGISGAQIIATVSKGSGESVKFREEKLPFNKGYEPGGRQMLVEKRLDLDALKMDVGDELYFYIEVTDNKQPRPNRTRSDTFFAIIKDTVSEAFAVEATMGVDLMPDYFRSQRQLIIDTEKLIKEKNQLSEPDFKSRSNELGFDQKALRIKYGQFMGDETEMAIEHTTEESSETAHENGHEGEEDPLAEYTHDHDGDNEHHLVPEEEDTDTEDPLHEYIHDHSNPEEATLFEESLKSKLRKALNIMWDAELYLRLYTPGKSLPYQYEALKLIQEIKNSARIYVHRIGFDPPPIKEDKRLTGDIAHVENVQQEVTVGYEPSFWNMRRAVSRLEVFLSGKETYGQGDNTLFAAAGNELARLAVEEPGRHLRLLQQLKGLEFPENRNRENYGKLHRGLFKLLPKTEMLPSAHQQMTDPVQLLFLKSLGNGS